MIIGKVFAQINIDTTQNTFPGTKLSLDQLFSGGINLFLGAIAVAAFAGLIYSGFTYITAGGDASKAEKARKNIMWTLLSLVVVSLSYVVIRMAANLPNL
ncbi:MAG: hypothetical protein WD157_01590 [Patescibacteria group bacterium]